MSARIWAGRVGGIMLALALVWLGGAPDGAVRTGAGGPAAQVAPLSPPVAVRVGMVPVVSGAGVYLALERGYFQAEGLDVGTENFDAGAQMIPLLGTGQLDVGSGATSAGIFNAVARGVPLRLVAAQSVITPGHGIIGVMIRRDLFDSAAIRDYGDLRGRRIAVPARNSSSEIVLDAALARGGLTLADVDLTEISLPDITTALANRSIDVGVQTEPTATLSAERGVAMRWRTADELTPGLLTAAWIYSPQFAERQPEAARRFMVGLLRGVRDYVNAFERGSDRAAVIETLIRHTPLKDRALYDRVISPGMAPDGYIDADALQNDIGWYVQRGSVQPGLDVRSLVDSQFADYAVQRLGRYQ